MRARSKRQGPPVETPEGFSFRLARMVDRAKVLVHGATGFTGKLVAGVLARKKIPFAIAGRNQEKLDAMAAELGGDVETVVVDIRDSESIEAALKDRKVVCACAGPFIEVGEPVLAAAAKMGVHYADTTGEQKFVALAVSRYGEIAEASGACAVPAFAYEIAVGDWAAHAAAQKAGENPQEINVVYMLRTPEGGMGGATSRGTKLSMIGMTADGEPRQFVDGELVRESAATYVRAFQAPNGKSVWTFSFPSPESVVVPSHTGARTVRTFMSAGKHAARGMQIGRAIFPSIVRAFKAPLERYVSKSSAGPEGDDRNARFDLLAEATKDGITSRVFFSGSDPYGLTAEIQAMFAARVLAGKITARGVVAPSVAVSPQDALSELGHTGLVMR